MRTLYISYDTLLDKRISLNIFEIYPDLLNIDTIHESTRLSNVSFKNSILDRHQKPFRKRPIDEDTLRDIRKHFYSNYIFDPKINDFVRAYIPYRIWLDGYTYLLGDILGYGAEGQVHILTSPNNERYVIKFYLGAFKKENQFKDMLALMRIRNARHWVVLPRIVNMEYNYTIFPLYSSANFALLQEKGYKIDHDLMNNFMEFLNAILATDGFTLADDHPQNYVCDKLYTNVCNPYLENSILRGGLKRIDFGSLKIIPKIPLTISINNIRNPTVRRWLRRYKTE